MNPVGEPDAGNPHVRFDERVGETGRARRGAPTRLYPLREKMQLVLTDLNAERVRDNAPDPLRVTRPRRRDQALQNPTWSLIPASGMSP